MTSYAPAARGEQRLRGLSLRERRVALWSILWVAGCSGTIGVFWPIVAAGGSPTVSDLVYRLTGGSFVAAGLVAWQRRPAERVGALMVATGFLFFVAPLAAQADSSIVQTVGLLGTDYWTIAFVVLLLVFPQSRAVRGRLEGALVVAFAIPLVVAQPLWLLFLDDPNVVNDLGFFPNDRAADWIDKGQRGLLLAATLSLFLLLVWRWWHASPPLRRVLLPVLAGGATMLSFGALLALDLINGTRSQTLLTVTVVVLATVPVAFVVGLLRSRLARVAIGDLVLTLRSEAAPAELCAAIARALHDPSATLAYWLPEYGTYGDLDGRLVSLPDGDGQQATTLIDREGRHVAALVHDQSLLDEPELLAAVTAAAGIALENAQLHVDLRARLEEVRGSRARGIEEGQKERKRLERDLHDGAQQRLVALALNLKLLERSLADPDARAQLDVAQREIDLSLAELRDVARGIHPAVVTGHGLAVALEQVAARAPLPVHLLVSVGGRLPEPVEVAAYYVVTESLTNVAKHAQASKVEVTVGRVDGDLSIEIVDDGVGGADSERGSGLRGLADRVEALDGRLRVWTPHGGGTRVRAEMPCA